PNAPDARVRMRLRRKIASIDAHVTPLEDGFSATLGQGARLLARVLLVLVVGAALTLVSLGILVSRLAVHAVREGDARRPRADPGLRGREERYRRLVDDANDLVYSHDLRGILLSVNRACLRATGYARDEVLGHNIAEMLSPDSLARAQSMMARKVEGGGGAT